MASLPSGTCRACEQAYFGSYENHRFNCQGKVPPKRARVASWMSVAGAISSADHDAVDSKSQSLVQAIDPGDVDDGEWASSVPGRPPPYTTTWSLVYVNRKVVASGGFEVACAEGCNGTIRLNSQLQEIDGASTPHGKLRRPPVCHVIPWVLLSLAMDDLARSVGKTLTDAFKRYVCWGNVTNLRTGHNGCNASGTKVVALTATSAEIGRAKAFVASCLSSYTDHPYQA